MHVSPCLDPSGMMVYVGAFVLSMRSGKKTLNLYPCTVFGGGLSWS